MIRRASLILTRNARPPLCARPLIRPLPARPYYPLRKVMERNEGPILADPNNVSDRLAKVLALHDKVKDPSAVKLGASFSDLGLNDLDLVEVMLMCEEEFGIEFTEEEGEKVRTVEDLARLITSNFYTS